MSEVELKSHYWDSQDRCIKCGDRDWYADKSCSENLILNYFDKWKLFQLELKNIKISSSNFNSGDYCGKWKDKYTQKKATAKNKNIIFKLTFDEYLYKAFKAKLTCPNQISNTDFQLGRYKDQGGYTVNNCRFITQLENTKERDEHFDISSHLTTIQKQRLESGNHHFLNQSNPWDNLALNFNSLEIWMKAQECYEWWIENDKKLGRSKLLEYFNFKSERSCRTLLEKFKSGWVPNEDESWLEWRDSNE